MERYEPNVKTVFKRNLDTSSRISRMSTRWNGWSSKTSTGLAMYRTGQIDCGPAQ
jgi:hypothetical protein